VIENIIRGHLWNRNGYRVCGGGKQKISIKGPIPPEPKIKGMTSRVHRFMDPLMLKKKDLFSLFLFPAGIVYLERPA